MLAACSLNLLVKVLRLKAENVHYLSPKECSLVIYSVVYIPKTSFKVKTALLMSLPWWIDTRAGRRVGSITVQMRRSVAASQDGFGSSLKWR